MIKKIFPRIVSNYYTYLLKYLNNIERYVSMYFLRKKIITIFIFVYFSNLSFSQEPLWKKTFGIGGEPIGVLAIDSQNNIYAAGIGFISCSKDGGENWTSISSGFTANDIFINPAGNIFAGTYFGVERSTNNSNTWTVCPNLQAEIESFSFLSPNILYAATHLNGLFYSSDNGNSWHQISDSVLPSELNCVAVDKDGNIFAGAGSRLGTFRSTDRGNSWTNILKGVSTIKINITPAGTILTMNYGLLQTGSIMSSQIQEIHGRQF